VKAGRTVGAFKYVGKSMPISDGEAKATGRIKYTGDMALEGLLYGKLVFSDRPHARIKSIDVNEAKAVPGVIQVYTCHNTPKVTFNSQMWFMGQRGFEDQELFPDVVRYVGDTVAAVVAENKESADKAAELLRIEYEPLPFVIDPEEAMQGKVIIHQSGNPFYTTEIKCGDVELAFTGKSGVEIVEDRVETPKIHHAAMENHVCIAVPDHNGRITVYSPCQIIYSVRMIIAKILGLPFNKVRVIKPPVGGSFGGKQEVTLEPYCALFALETGRPVKIAFDRQASIVSTRTRTKTIGYVKTAVDQDGRILARNMDMVVDTGAYTTNGSVICHAMGKKLFRLYRIENQRFCAVAVHTNTPIAGAARGYGSPQVQAAAEINLDHAAKKIGIDPVEFRLKNLVHPFDPDSTGGPSLGNARIIDCVLKGAKEFSWHERWSRPRDTGRWRRGVGVACATHVNGYYQAYQDFGTMTLRMLEDGSLMLNAGLHDLGNGTVTAMKQIVAEVMDISPDRIEAPEGDTDISPYDIGCQASRVIYVCGANAMKAAENLRQLLIAQAAKIFNCCPDDICVEDGMIWSRKNLDNKMEYGRLAGLIQQKHQIELTVTLTYQAQANPGSYGVNFVEVEVDTLTGFVKVLDVVAVHDIGQAINTGFVEGQIHGGIQMGLGLALTEDLAVHPRTGVTGGNRLSKYHLINAPDMPPVRIFLIEKGEDFGPFGAKSIGEIATIPSAPATVNAINHALNTHLTVLPLTPARIVDGIRKGQRGL
jgi:CO/xanthine dehydrogenase Mo-binding subunit